MANLATISFSRGNLLHSVSQVYVYPVIPMLRSIRTHLQNVEITSNMCATCRAELRKNLIIAHRIDKIYLFGALSVSTFRGKHCFFISSRKGSLEVRRAATWHCVRTSIFIYFTAIGGEKIMRYEAAVVCRGRRYRLLVGSAP